MEIVTPDFTEDFIVQRLILLQATTKVLGQSPYAEKNLNDIFAQLGDTLASTFKFQHARLVILDHSGNNTQLIVDWPTPIIQETDTYQFIGGDNLFKNLSQQQSILTFKTRPDSICFYQAPTPFAFGICRILSSQGRLNGTLSMQWEKLPEPELEKRYPLLLEDLNVLLSNTIENSQYIEQSRQRTTQQVLLNEITQAIRQSLAVKEILSTLVEKLQNVLHVDCVFTHVTTPTDEFIHFEANTQKHPFILNPVDQSELEKAIFNRRKLTPNNTTPYVIHALNPEEALSQKGNVKSIAIFPLTGIPDNPQSPLPLIGSLSLQQFYAQRAWTNDDLILVQAVCEQVSMALHQAQLFETTQQQKQQLEMTLTELSQTQLQLIQSEKMAVIGQFVAGIAHDVNTPLAIITANQDTASQYLERVTTHDDKSKQALEQVNKLMQNNQKAALRIRDIVDNLRNFARLDESNRKIANIHDGLDSTLQLLESQFTEKQIKIVRHYYTNLPAIECFPGLLNQVFQNLLVNAMQAFDETITQKQITITTQTCQDTNQIEIIIADNGKGIAEEHLNRIFDPGFTTKGVGVGTGLGLALCYKIIEKHGGQLNVQSILNQGSRFIIQLN